MTDWLTPVSWGRSGRTCAWWRTRWGTPRRRARAARSTGTSVANCIKIGLPWKSILRDYFQENMTSRRPFLILRISFLGRPNFIQFIPVFLKVLLSFCQVSRTFSEMQSKSGSGREPVGKLELCFCNELSQDFGAKKSILLLYTWNLKIDFFCSKIRRQVMKYLRIYSIGRLVVKMVL